MAEYKYDAFISYRHLEPDSFVAENVHKLLENYKIPKKLQKSLGRKRINRIFRDREELPITDNLNDQIIDSLKQSEYLIVICSPRLEESKWCKREIETFVEERGKKNVLLVLADGEPDTAFPKIIYDGNSEPLAAEARGKNDFQRKKLLKTEKLRLLAQILKVDFDDLKQRHRERRIRQIVTGVSIGAAIVLAFSVLAIGSAIKISRQAAQLAYDKAVSLAEESEKLLEDDKRLEALSVAKEALTTSDGIDLPSTSQARYALVDALRVYDSAKYSKAVLEIDSGDTVCAMEFNQNPFEVIFLDKSGEVSVWKFSDYQKIFVSYDGITDAKSEHIAGFINENKFFYINNEGKVVIASVSSDSNGSDGSSPDGNSTESGSSAGSDNGNTNDGSIVDIILDNTTFTSAFINDQHDRLAAIGENKLFVYDLNDYKVLYYDSIEGDDTLTFSDCIGWDEDNNRILYSVYKNDTSVREELKVADLKDNSIACSALFAEAKMEDCVCKDGVFYVLSGHNDGDLCQSYVCSIDSKDKSGKWTSSFNGTPGELLITSADSLSVSAGNDLYIYNCKNGKLLGNYSFGADVGCLTEKDGALYVRNLNGDSSVIDTKTGAYSFLGKLIECTELRKLKALEITEYNYAYMGIPANGNDNHLIFYNYMENDYARPYEGSIPEVGFDALFASEAAQKVKDLGIDEDNTVYSVVSDRAGLSVISYKNGMIVLCDEKKGKELCSKNIGDVIDRYSGEDAYGNKYFGNEGLGVMISPEKEIVAAIEDMISLSEDGTELLMQSFDTDRHPVVLAYQIYDEAMLLDRADYILDYYNY